MIKAFKQRLTRVLKGSSLILSVVIHEDLKTDKTNFKDIKRGYSRE